MPALTRERNYALHFVANESAEDGTYRLKSWGTELSGRHSTMAAPEHMIEEALRIAAERVFPRGGAFTRIDDKTTNDGNGNLYLDFFGKSVQVIDIRDDMLFPEGVTSENAEFFVIVSNDLTQFRWMVRIPDGCTYREVMTDY